MMLRSQRRAGWTGICLSLFCLPAAVQACATCFGASDSDLAQGMNMGILSLLGVIGTVLLGIASFFVFLAWRTARRAAATDDALPSEWADLSPSR
jgi:hypothetical protein